MERKTILTLASLAALAAPAPTALPQVAPTPCEAAWEAYRDLKASTVMDESQYPLTAEGAAVRANCGRKALPAPENADINPVRPRVHRPPPPSQAPKPPSASAGTMP